MPSRCAAITMAALGRTTVTYTEWTAMMAMISAKRLKTSSLGARDMTLAMDSPDQMSTGKETSKSARTFSVGSKRPGVGPTTPGVRGVASGGGSSSSAGSCSAAPDVGGGDG